MDRYARSHLADHTLLRSAETNAGRERTSMADLLADIAEIDVRRLYVPAAYPSIHAYCMGRLRLSEDAASKRIHAARAARRFPVIFGALAEGRLNLSGVCLLAARLTEDTAGELIAAAMDQSKAQIERLLAARFPQSDLLSWVETAPAVASPTAGEHAPGHVQVQIAPPVVAPSTAGEHAPGHVEDAAAAGPVPAQPTQGHGYARVTPLSADSFGVQFTVNHGELDLVQHAQDLLPGDVKEVFMRALREHVRRLEKGKFAATDKPRSACPRPTPSTRHIPADVRDAVWNRDGGQCTFVSDTGHRCEARRHIQFDHIEPVARGGQATVSGIRLLCRAHNQYAAERTFGAEFMRHKRRAAQHVAAAKRAAAEKRRAAAGAHTTSQPQTTTQDPERDVTPWLRALGFNAAEARRAAAACEAIPESSLEERVRFGLSLLRPPHRRLAASGVAGG